MTRHSASLTFSRVLLGAVGLEDLRAAIHCINGTSCERDLTRAEAICVLANAHPHWSTRYIEDLLDHISQPHPNTEHNK